MRPTKITRIVKNDNLNAILLLEISTKCKSNLQRTHGGTLKRVTSDGAYLRGLGRGQHCFQETSQQWRAVGDTGPIYPGRESKPRPPVPISFSNTFAG